MSPAVPTSTVATSVSVTVNVAGHYDMHGGDIRGGDIHGGDIPIGHRRGCREPCDVHDGSAPASRAFAFKDVATACLRE